MVSTDLNGLSCKICEEAHLEPVPLASRPSAPWGGCILSVVRSTEARDHTEQVRGGVPMSALVAVLMSSVLWLCPILVEAGTTGEQRPEQRQLLTKDNLKLVQERLKT